jgi:PAS domain S-box-containing protein
MVLKKEISLQIKDLLQKNPQGLSITDIVKEVKINRNTAGRYLENLLVSGQVDMRRLGMAKIYMISQRVPLSAVLSVSSEMVVQLDRNMRIIFANDPFLRLIGSERENFIGKNIEFTSAAVVFEDPFSEFLENIRQGIEGNEWSGEIVLSAKKAILFCRIAPTVFEDGRKGVTVILDDVTSQREAQQKLEESERQFRLLAENSVDMIGRIKPDYTHSYASPAYTTTLGYLPEEVIGKPGHLFIHPDDVPIVEAAESNLTPQNSSTTIIFRSKHKAGHYIWTESHVRAIFDEKTRELSEYYAIIRDINDQKTAEEELRNSEDKYRKLIEISPDSVLLHREGKIIYANPATFRLLHATQSDQIIGKKVLDFISPAFRDLIRKNIQKDLLGQESPWTELRMIRLDGETITVEGRGIATVIDGKTTIQVAIRDVTEQKRAEDALKTKERQLFSIYSNVPDVLFYLSVEVDNRFRFLTVNQAFLDTLNLTENQVVGKYVDEVIPEPLYSRARGKYHQAISEKRTIQWEEVQDYPAGKRYGDCHVTAVFDETGHPTNIIGSVHDSTQYRSVETALQKSEDLYRSLAEASTDLIFVIGKDDRVEYVNSFASSLVNKPADQIIGHPRTTLFPPEIATNQKKALETVFETGSPVRREGYLTFAGRAYWFDHFLVPLKDAGNHVKSVLGISRDITDRRELEQELQESEEKYRNVINRANDVICIIQDGIIKMCNPRLSEFWGGPLEEIIGRHISGFVHPDVWSEVIARYNRRIAGEKIPQIYETVLMHKDGSRSFVELNAGIILYEGKPADLVIIRDINDRKKAEQELRESAARLNLLLDSTDDLIFMQDPEGRYLYFNAAARYGVSKQKMIGSTPHAILDKESADRIVERVKKVAKTGRSIREETPLVWKGQPLWFSDSLSPVRNDKGTITAVVTVSRNITERKTAEIALRESEATARALLNAPTDSVILIDSEGKILALNEIAASRFGKRSDELVGIMSYDLLPKEVAQLRRSLMAPVLEKREMVRFVDQRDGRWYDTVAYPIMDEAGTVKKIAIIARDVTEQKNIEKQLRKSEQMYKSLLEQSFDAIAIHSQGKITFLNERAAKVLGSAKPEDLTGRPIFDFIHPESRKDLEDRLKELSATEGMSAPVITEKFIRTDGSTVTVEVMAIRFDDNGIPAFRVAFREVIA